MDFAAREQQRKITYSSILLSFWKGGVFEFVDGILMNIAAREQKNKLHIAQYYRRFGRVVSVTV